MTRKSVRGKLRADDNGTALANVHVPTAQVPVKRVPKKERAAFGRAVERARVKELSEIVASLGPSRHFLPNGQPLLRRIRNVGRIGTVTAKRRLPPWGSDWRNKHLERNGHGWLFKNGSGSESQEVASTAKVSRTAKGKGRKPRSSFQKAWKDYRRSMNRKGSNLSVACSHLERAIALANKPDQIRDLCGEIGKQLEFPQPFVRGLVAQLNSRVTEFMCRTTAFDEAQEWFRAICDEAVPIDKQSIFMHVVQLADSAKRLRCVYDCAKGRMYTKCVSSALQRMAYFAAQLRSLHDKAKNEGGQEMIERELAILFG